MTSLATGTTVRRDAGLYGYERALRRRGLVPVAGVDEAGRGACAGPLVTAAVVLDRPIPGLNDSKLLTARRRDEVFDVIMDRAVDVSVVTIPAADCDRLGLHRANLASFRRAIAKLETKPGYVLTDGFPVDGLGLPGLAVWKGDQVSASIAAASVIAKVTRDRLMMRLHDRYPAYDFGTHKGYVTSVHDRALHDHGPCPEHRRSFVNVRAAMAAREEPNPMSSIR